MPKYSIVTPVYNSFDLMKNYFKSLENQTFKDFEVVLVDDCSTDGSFDKLKDFAKTSSLNLTVLQTEKNAGPGNARNIGMDAAQGEYITFIDNDDWIENDSLKRIETVFKNNDVKCVIFDYYIQGEQKKTVARSMYYGENGPLSLSNCMIYARNHTVGKVYSLTKCRERNVRFPNLRRCEDVAFVCRAIEACESVFYLKEPLYYYYQRSNSLSNNKSLDESDMVKAFSYLEKDLLKKYPEEIKQKSITDLLYGATLMMCKANKPNKVIREYIDSYTEKYPEWDKCEIINHIGKAKKLFLKFISSRNIFLLKILAGIHTRMVG